MTAEERQIVRRRQSGMVMTIATESRVVPSENLNTFTEKCAEECDNYILEYGVRSRSDGCKARRRVFWISVIEVPSG